MHEHAKAGTDALNAAPAKAAPIRADYTKVRFTYARGEPLANAGEWHHAARSEEGVRNGRTEMSYFIVKASVPPEELKRLGDQKVQPGMQTDMFIITRKLTSFVSTPESCAACLLPPTA